MNLPSQSSNYSWIAFAAIFIFFGVGRTASKILQREDTSSRVVIPSGPGFPETIIECPGPFKPNSYASLQAGMSKSMVLHSLGYKDPAELARHTQYPHYQLRFEATDGQIIETEFWKGALKRKRFFASDPKLEDEN